MNDDVARAGVEQQQIVVIDSFERIVRADDHRQTHAARQDRAVRQRAAARGDDAENAVLGQVREFGRRECVADENGTDTRCDLPLRRRGIPRKCSLHATDDVINILAATAQIWIVDRIEHGGESIALHFQRSARPIATATNQIEQSGCQFRIVQNHAVGIDELADFARQCAV